MAKNQIILCDTNIFINLFRGKEIVKNALRKIGEENMALSVITYAEIIYGTKKTDLPVIKAFFEKLKVIEIDTKISQEFKGIILNYSNSHHIKIPDAIIAATSINLGYPLYTENKKDFDFIREIKLYHP